MNQVGEELFDLSAIADGSVEAPEALRKIREIIADKGVGEHIYASLCSGVGQTLARRPPSDEARAWFDACKQVSSLFRQQEQATLATQVGVLADLCLAAAKFSELHSKSALLKRSYVLQILEMLRDRGAKDVRRSDVQAETGIGDAHLSKVLRILEASGLVLRGRVNKEVTVTLTPEGFSALSAKHSEPDPSPTTQPQTTRLDMMPPVWRAEG